eukprot:TRINITY_DN5955_c0_g1_i1.p1 TRINITY_DN5955_c0_g1~~TRINITY_DN5955_c0_g1_i1.p1  ORF type:complete len:445 (+),score=42.31 TRINITY_DN5955_c0_g1_i1:11-1345(+)
MPIFSPMSVEKEDVFENKFFKYLQSNEPLYKKAESHCWLICVPQTPALNGLKLTKEIIDAHILKPSPFFQGIYEVHNDSEKTCEIDGDLIKTTKGFPEIRKANIIYEELFYNQEYKPYKVVLINLPLMGGSSKINIQTPGFSPMPPSKDWDMCMQYLYQFPENTIVLRKVNEKIQEFLHTYVIVKGFEAHVRSKIAVIVDMAVEQLLCANVDFRKMQNNDRQYREICLIIESYIMYTLYDKLFLEFQNTFTKEDKYLSSVFNYHLHNTPPKLFGIGSGLLSVDYSPASEVLNNLEKCSTPLQMLYILEDTTEKIAECVEMHYPEGDRGSDTSITTDDLIPIIGLVIINCKYDRFHYALFLMENFIFADISTSKLMFNLINFKAAIGFLTDHLNHNVKTLNSSSSVSSKPSHVSPTLSPSNSSGNLYGKSSSSMGVALDDVDSGK